MMINDYKFSRVCLALARDTASKEKALPMHLHPLYQVNAMVMIMMVAL